MAQHPSDVHPALERSLSGHPALERPLRGLRPRALRDRKGSAAIERLLLVALALLASGRLLDAQTAEGSDGGPPRGVLVRERGGVARRTVLPCRIPFAPGETRDPARTHHLEDRGAKVAAEWRVLTRWRDGSARDASAIVPFEIEGGGQRVLRLREGPGPAAPAPTFDGLLLSRLPAQRESAPWLELVSEVEDHAGTIHRARLRLDPSFGSPHHGGLVQAFRFRDYHRGIGSELERDFLTLSGWLELKSRDEDLHLDLQLGNDYRGVARTRGQLDPEAFPLGAAVRFRRWTVRVRGWLAAPFASGELALPGPRPDLGWLSLDLLQPLPRGADGTEAFHVLLDGQTLVRSFALAPTDPARDGERTAARYAELARRAAQPLVARPLLPGLRASGAYGLLGALGPASLPLLEHARLRAERRRAILADEALRGPFGAFAARLRSGDPSSSGYAPLISWYQGVDAEFDLQLLSTYQLLALRPVHLFAADAAAQREWRGDLSLGRPVNTAPIADWLAKTPPSAPAFASKDPVLLAPSDELLELYLATLRPYLLDQLRFHRERTIAASRVPFSTSTRAEAELLRAAVLCDRAAPSPLVREALVQRWRSTVMPGLPEIRSEGRGPYYVLAQEPSPSAWGPDIYWDSPADAGLFAAAAIAAWREWGEELFLEGAMRAGVFVASAWMPLPDGRTHGLAREIPVFLQERGERQPLYRDWYTSEQPIEWQAGNQTVRTTRRARLRPQLDEIAARCESPLLLLAEIARERRGMAGIPAARFAELPTRWEEIARALHAAAPPDAAERQYAIGADPWRQVVRDRATRGDLAVDVVPPPSAKR